MAQADETALSMPPRKATLPLSPVLRWATLGLLALGALVAFVDRTNISAAIAVDSFKDYFNLSDLDRGFINSAFFWSYAALQVPMGWIVDRYGVKYPYAICFGIWCLASAAIGLTTVFWALILLRLFVGAAEAVVVPSTYRWIRTNFDPNESGLAVGIYMLGTKLGPAIGAPLAAWLIVHFDWKLMFLMTGAAGLLWLIPWFFLAKNDWPKSTDVAQKKKAASSVPVSNIFSSPLVWGTLVVNFCYNYFTFFCLTWMPAYLVEQRGLSLQAMGLYTFYTFMGIALVSLTAGFVADRLIKRFGSPIFIRKAFVISGFVLACTVLLGARAETVQEALFWNVFSLSALGLTTSNNIVLCSLTLIPQQVVGFVKGFQNVATASAGILAPIITGWLLHVTGSYVAPMTCIFFFLVLGAATVLLVLRPQWAPRIPGEEPASFEDEINLFRLISNRFSKSR